MLSDSFLADRDVAGTALIVQFREELIAATELAEVGPVDWLDWKWDLPRTILGWARDLTLDYGM